MRGVVQVGIEVNDPSNIMMMQQKVEKHFNNFDFTVRLTPPPAFRPHFPPRRPPMLPLGESGLRLGVFRCRLRVWVGSRGRET